MQAANKNHLTFSLVDIDQVEIIYISFIKRVDVVFVDLDSLKLAGGCDAWGWVHTCIRNHPANYGKGLYQYVMKL